MRIEAMTKQNIFLLQWCLCINSKHKSHSSMNIYILMVFLLETNPYSTKSFHLEIRVPDQGVCHYSDSFVFFPFLFHLLHHLILLKVLCFFSHTMNPSMVANRFCSYFMSICKESLQTFGIMVLG